MNYQPRLGKIARMARIVFSGVLAVAVTTGHAQNVPDAPPPPPLGQQPPTPPTHVPVPATRPPTVEALNKREWSGVVEPGEKIPPFHVRQKLLFPLHEELRPVTTLVPDLYSGGYGVWRNTNPKLGTDAAGFGDRVGEAALRQLISREISDSFLPILLHQDPRYYRQAYGSYFSRTEHVVRRVFITQTDSGHRTFNTSDVLGRGMGAALTQAYYPDRSRSAGVVFRTWGTSLVALGAGDLFEEFWPDVKRKWFHHSQ